MLFAYFAPKTRYSTPYREPATVLEYNRQKPLFFKDFCIFCIRVVVSYRQNIVKNLTKFETKLISCEASKHKAYSVFIAVFCDYGCSIFISGGNPLFSMNTPILVHGFGRIINIASRVSLRL